MNKKAPLIIGLVILVIVIILVLVVPVADEDNNLMNSVKSGRELSKEEMARLKLQYEGESVALEFENDYKKIELAVANKMLDGTVTSEQELQDTIAKINDMFKGEDWTYLNLEFSDYWMGTWSLDNTGKLYFTFYYEEIKPEWVKTVSVKDNIK